MDLKFDATLKLIIASAIFICAPLAALNAAPGEAATATAKPAALVASGAVADRSRRAGHSSERPIPWAPGRFHYQFHAGDLDCGGGRDFVRPVRHAENPGSAVGRAEFLGMAGGGLHGFSKASLDRDW